MNRNKQEYLKLIESRKCAANKKCLVSFKSADEVIVKATLGSNEFNMKLKDIAPSETMEGQIMAHFEKADDTLPAFLDFEECALMYEKICEEEFLIAMQENFPQLSK